VVAVFELGRLSKSILEHFLAMLDFYMVSLLEAAKAMPALSV